MFQNSGIHAYHYGDEEDHVIFFGADVDARDIVILLSDSDGFRGAKDWIVKSRADTSLYKGGIDKCMKWVMQNFVQYRKSLTRR